eukprot:NODE_248_length_1755_cov_500.451176.p1 GENE.NODE_248_length_1755_cov_500.451176~~NODE_248_length_1755_cov_500.451176.p1  ORF type:complete len:549 (+),score=122.61 NODE_248_length_1755_cov_500.451176:3-1649(+)
MGLTAAWRCAASRHDEALAKNGPLNSMQGLGLGLAKLFAGAAPMLRDPAEGIQALVDETCSFWNITGCSVGVNFNGSEVLASFGVLDKDGGAAVGADSLFQIGSTTKAFTGMAILQRVAKGELDLDVPVVEYLPEFRVNSSCSGGLTLRDLLSHRTGMPRHDMLWAELLPPNRSQESRRDAVRRFPSLALDKPVRYRSEYNNLMVMTAGLIAGLGHEDGWEGLVAEKILRPLNMTDTWLHEADLDSDARSRFATPYLQDDTIPELLHTELIGPAGSIVSSATELLKWLKAHMDQLNGKTPLVDAATATELLHANSVFGLLNPFFGTYTVTWWFEQLTSEIYLLHHGGNTNGFTSSNVVVLQADQRIFGGGASPMFPLAGFSILTNQDSSIAPLMLTLQITSLLAKLPLISNLNQLQWEAMAPTRTAEAEAFREFEQRIRDGEKQPSNFTTTQLEGVYEDSGYGQLAVASLAVGALTLAPNGQDPHPLVHLWFDTFGMKSSPTAPLSPSTVLPFTFVGVCGGLAARMEAVLEPTVPAIVFERVQTAAVV